MGACNQGRKVLEFLLWCRHCRHSFGFSRNNMKGALYHWRNPMVRNSKKGKFLIFHFCCCQVLGMKSLTSPRISKCGYILYIWVGLLDSQASEKHSLDSMAKCPYGKTSLCIFVIFWRINIFSVFRFELECYSTLSNVLHFLR